MKVIPKSLFGLLLGAIIFNGSFAHLAVGKKKAKDKQSEAAKPDFQEVFKKLDAGARAAMKKDPKEGLNEVERVGRLLIKDYPEEPIPYSMLAFVAGRTGDKEKKVSIFKELAATKSSNPKVAQVCGSSQGRVEENGSSWETSRDEIHGRRWAGGGFVQDEGQSSVDRFLGDLVRALRTARLPKRKERPTMNCMNQGFEIIGVSLSIVTKKKLEGFLGQE